ncbi:hypothetical protein SAMCFNEI73_Ch3299 [Sinorhizobium americanum]|uniref:Uncharacterized protein n=1 Tax=Sinorhizobium americanum TaxID=194963 RepID=A0A1L3LR44_9HYPH|nr:hypothetical protein SAMCFNEI73_Ch3299 [Sinorhizobium americanum]
MRHDRVSCCGMHFIGWVPALPSVRMPHGVTESEERDFTKA